MTRTLASAPAPPIAPTFSVAVLESAAWVVKEYEDDLFDGWGFDGDESIRDEWYAAAAPLVLAKMREFWAASGHIVIDADAEVFQSITDAVDLADGQPCEFVGPEIRLYVPPAQEALDNWATIVASINPDRIAATL